MKVLITGGSGFIGSHLAKHLHGNAEIRILDNLSSASRRNLAGLCVKLVAGSILDVDLVRKLTEGVDYVFHLAARISVPESMRKPHDYVATNVTGTLNVLEASALAGVRKLIFASSAAVYGDNPEVPKLESMTPEPKSPYAITKLDGEQYCAMFHREGWLKTASARFFNAFGPRQEPGNNYGAAVPLFVARALRNQEITIFGDGEQTRDFIYVEDIAAALSFLATNEETSGVYNCGYGQRISINELAQRIITAADSKSTIQHAAERAGDVKHSQASVERLLAAGFKPVSDLDRGLAATLDWFKSKKP